MSTENYDVLSVCLNGKNYPEWAFQFEKFVKGKDLWGHVDGTSSAPDIEKQEDDYAQWVVKDSQVMAWIIGSVDPNIFLNQIPFNTAANMWTYLKKLYSQNNLARWFQLEHEIAMFQQDSLSISEFYLSFMTLWNKYANIVYEGLSAADIIAVQKVHQTTKRDLFLMKLRSDYEGIRSNLVNRATVPTLGACFVELLCEEQCLRTQTIMGQQKSASLRVRNPSSDLSPLGQGDSYSNFSNSIHGIGKYDVFISFRGTDTRDNFSDHLYHHLIRKGIFTFKDDKMLEKGQPISPQLLQAIKESRVSIIIFSKDYAASTWCLDEMATIFDCHKDLKQTVFPVFYDVDPSVVRKQNGVYENAFVSHTQRFEEDPGKVDRWKRAMMGLANFVGWDVRKKPEFMEIEKIVQEVIKTLGHKFSGLADDLIGIQPRVDELEKLLKLSSEDDGCRVLGICGMGGIGKTTLATVLYDRISYQFHACCFIEDTSQICKNGGHITAQKQILRQTLCETNLDTYSPFEISRILRNRLCNIKVLVVLDNVDSLFQLESLAINPNLLCAGSRIVITTRDEHILETYGADAIYKVPLLNNNDSRELFSTKAFKSVDPSTQFMKLTLTPKVLKYTQGLPLAIRVLGSFLCTRDATQWRDALDRVGNNPDNQIMDVLRISFEGLQPEEKEIFLHIACFFNREREDYVKRILDGCGLHPHIGIQLLIEKSTVTIRNQEIHMHGMLQDLGRKIVREESPNPGSWSRLWRYDDFHCVLMSKMGTNNTTAIVLDQNVNASRYELLSSKELSKMGGLKLLIIYERKFEGILNFLSNNLQCLLWYGYPFISLPSNFQPNKLVELNMSGSSIERLWEGIKNLPCLKRLDLSNSKRLVEMPNFEEIPNLERLDLTGCTNLSHVHPSFGLLEELVFLSLQNCSNLVSLYLDSASNFYLKVLHLSGCTRLENTPDFTGMSNLEYLDLERCTSLYTIHESIGYLVKLKFLSLRCCSNLVTIPNSVNTMTSLTTLDLHRCSKLQNFPLGQRSELEESTYVAISGYVPSSCMGSLVFLDLGYCNLCEIHDAIGELSSLERLNLQGNNFASLPDTISELLCLAYLNLSHCHMLQCLPLLPSSNASSVGKYFEKVSGARNHRSGLYIYDCPKLVESEHGQLLGSKLALAWLTRLVEEPRHFRCGFDIVIHGSVIPEWFNHQFIGGSVIRTVHSDVDDNWIGFAFCVAFEVNYHQAILDSSHNSSASMLAQSSSLSSSLPHPLYLSFESENTEESFKLPLSFDLEKNVHSKYLWLIYISQPHCHFVKSGAHITFKACPDLEIRKWGLRMIFKQDIVPMNGGLNFEKEPPSELQKTDKGIGVDCCHFDHVHEAQRWSSSYEKIQLPYNWLVTEKEEIENMEAKEKENNFAFIGH